MCKEPKPYQSYLLRVWHAQEVRDTWRVSLEDAETRELRGFASLEAVFEFLRREVEEQNCGRNNDEMASGGDIECETDKCTKAS